MKSQALRCDILVVGAGPAGMAAAAAARESGADVICVDLFVKPGGQYHMQPPSTVGPFADTAQVQQGKAAEDRCRKLGVRFLSQTEIFWAEPDFTVYANQAGNPVALKADAMVVASGAMERALPFKGWTLPGVMTAGGAQRLIKSSNTAPGKNVVLAGSGPFLLAVANTFAQAKFKLDYYVELQRPQLSALSLLAKNPGRFAEALKLFNGLRGSGAKRFTGHQVVEALGDGRLEAIRVAPLDARGQPQAQKSFVVENVDALCIGYGFRPVIDITSLLHADHHFDDALGGWVCSVDDNQATSVKGLFAAGETTGIGGSVPARLSGRLAGIQAATFTGHRRNDVEPSTLQRELTAARDFAAGLARLFPFPAHLVEQMGSDEIVCRCEDVKRSDIDAAIADGASDAFSVKMWTRAGMGPCQGRICGSALSELIARRLGGVASDADYNRPHMPLRPVSLAVVEAALGRKAEFEKG